MSTQLRRTQFSNHDLDANTEVEIWSSSINFTPYVCGFLVPSTNATFRLYQGRVGEDWAEPYAEEELVAGDTYHLDFDLVAGDVRITLEASTAATVSGEIGTWGGGR